MMMDPNEMVSVPVLVPASKVGMLYAAVAVMLGGASVDAMAATLPTPRGSTAAEAAHAPEKKGTDAAPAVAVDTSAGVGAGDASGEVDAEGHPWSEAMHASTKSKTKAGLWRMKVGVTRPDPAPGFSKVGETDAPTVAGSDAASGAASPSSTPVATAPAADDDDEFAAFRAAADKSDAQDASAAASVQVRKWTDADLGKLCNQAAVKLGDPAPVKALIGEFVGSGAVPHSRNIPEDKREDFAKAVEAKAGITFEG